MPEERLSIIEQRIRNSDERQRLGGAVRASVWRRPPPSPEQVAAAERDRKARALPDDMFDTNPTVQRLRATYETRRAIADDRGGYKATLERAAKALAERVQRAEREARWWILEDAAAGDEAFESARQAVTELQSDRELLEAMRRAQKLVSTSAADMQELHDQVRQARMALGNHLMALKLAHVDAQVSAEGATQ